MKKSKEIKNKLLKMFEGKVESKYLLIGLVCFLVVFMLTAQIKSISVSKSDILRLKKENELRDEITQWKDVYENATIKINELNSKISEYQVAASKRDDSVALIKSELDNAKILAGLEKLKGPGIEITLDDTKAIEQIALETGIYDKNMYIIHDSDLVMTVNELLSAGAEAISINGQRIISNTSIRCTGPQVLINGIRMVAPFKINAIGDSTTLQGALNLRGGIVDSMKSSNIDVTIVKQEEMIVPAYEKVISFQYATVAEEGVTK